MSQCGTCGHENDDGLRFCVACGAPLTAFRGTGAETELQHIAWLLQKIPEWKARGLISPGNAGMLARFYTRRREELLRGEEVALGIPAPPAPGEYRAEPGQPAIATSLQSGPAPSPGDDSAGPPEERGKGLAEFLEEHWLKVLGLLAAALIFAGIRQFLDWEWISRMARVLLPLVPAVSSLLLIRIGITLSERNAVVARTLSSVGVALVTFAVTSANRRWLYGALEPSWCLALGTGMSTAVAAVVLGRTGDRFFEHLMLGGTTLTVYLLMRAAFPLHGEPMASFWRYGIPLLFLGMAYLAYGLREARRGAEAVPAIAWAHVCFALVLWFAVLPRRYGQISPFGSVVLLAVGSLAYVVAAQILNQLRLAWVASAGMFLAGVLLLDVTGMTPTWHGWTLLFLSLGIVTAGLAVANGLPQGRPVSALRDIVRESVTLGQAYGMLSLGAFAASGVALVTRALDDLSRERLLENPAWPELVVPGLVLCAIYAVVSFRLREPSVLYASATVGALALMVASDRALVAFAVGRSYRSSLDLFFCAAMAVASAAWLRRRKAEGELRESRQWTEPLLIVGVVSVACNLILAMIGYATWRMEGAFWWAVVPATGLALATALWLARWHRPLLGGIYVAAGLAGVAILAAFGAHSLGTDTRSALFYASASLAAFAVLTIGIAAQLPVARAGQPADGVSTSSDVPPETVWLVPLRVVGTLALVVTLGMTLPYNEQGALDTLALREAWLLAIVVIGLAAASVIRSRADTTALTATGAVLLFFWWLTLAGRTVPTPHAALLVLAAAFASTALFVAGSRAVPYAGSIGALAAGGGWYALTAWLIRMPSGWLTAVQAPIIAALYVQGARYRPVEDEVPLFSVRRVALILVTLHYLHLLPRAIERSVTPWYAPALTLALYGLLAGLRAGLWPDRIWCGLVSGHLWAAVAAALYGARWPETHAAVVLGACSGVLVLGARLLESGVRTRDMAVGAYLSAALSALAVILVALAGVSQPGQGEAGLLAIALAGTVWAGLYVLRQGTWYAHLAAAAYFLAYAIFLYDRVALNAGVIDLYLIPVGIYLLVLGHLAARRGKPEEAQELWWIGLLLVMTPTYTAFYVQFTTGGPAWHALLLVSESVLAVLWGIAHRIRAFVLCGTLFALAFAAVLVASAITQIWVGIVALVSGLVLLSLVYWLGVRHTHARAVIERAIREWERWR